MPRDTVGSNGWIRIVDGRASGFYNDAEVINAVSGGATLRVGTVGPAWDDSSTQPGGGRTEQHR